VYIRRSPRNFTLKNSHGPYAYYRISRRSGSYTCLYFGGRDFEYWPGDPLLLVIVSPFLLILCRQIVCIVTQNKQKGFPSTSFPIHLLNSSSHSTLFNLTLNNFKEPNLWETDSRSSGQEISHLLRNPTVLRHVHRRPTMDPIANHLNIVHILKPSFLQNPLQYYLRPGISSGFFPPGWPDQKF
jgi:hypothetical protein